MTNIDHRNTEPPIPRGIPGSYNNPQEILDRRIKQAKTIPGAGGAMVSQPLDTMFIPPKSKEKTQPSHDPLSFAPRLPPAALTTETARLQAEVLIGFVADTFLDLDLTPSNKSIPPEELPFDPEMEDDEIPPSPDATPGAITPETTVGATSGTETGKVDSPPTQEKPMTPAMAFQQWLDGITKDLASPLQQLTTEQRQLLETMQSSDPKILYTCLLSLAKLDTLTLTDKEKTALESHLTNVSEQIAKANEEGGFPFMESGMPGIVKQSLTLLFKDGVTPSSALDTVLTNISNSIADVNMAKTTAEQPSIPAFDDIFGGDKQKIEAQLRTLLTKAGIFKAIPAGLTQEQLDSILRSLSETIATKSHKQLLSLQSIDSETLSEEISKILVSLGLPTELLAIMQTAVIPALAEELSGINTLQMHKQLYSSDPSKVQQALEELSGIHKDKTLDAPTKSFCMNYLTALTAALVFMAQIRGLISKLEGMLTDALSKAKLANTAAQLALSAKLLDSKLTEAIKTLETQNTSIDTSRIMKVLMPLLAVFIALIALVMIIGSLGTATGPALCMLIGALVMAAVTLAYAVADMISSFSSGKSLFEHLFEALKIDDPTTRMIIQTLVNVFIAVIITVCTFGAGVALIAVQTLKAAADIAAKTTMEVIKNVLKAVVEGVKKALIALLKDAGGKMLLGGLVASSFSGGLLTDALYKALKKIPGLSDLAAQIIAAVISLIVMLTAMLTILAAIPKLLGKMLEKFVEGPAKLAAEQAKKGLEAAQEALKKANEALAKATTEGATDATKAALQQTVTAAEEGVNAAKEGLKVAEEALTAAQNRLKDLMGELKPKAGEKAGVASTGSGAAVGDQAETASKAVKSWVERLMDALKGGKGSDILKILKVFTELLTIATSIVKAVSSFIMADLKTQTAVLAHKSGDIEALFEKLKSMQDIGIGDFVKKLLEDGKNMQQIWNDLITIVQGFINDASKRLGELHAQAS
jgi:hypothetical protein